MIRIIRIARHFYRLQMKGWTIGHQSSGNNLHAVTITKGNDIAILRYIKGKLDRIEANHKWFDGEWLMLTPYTEQETENLKRIILKK